MGARLLLGIGGAIVWIFTPVLLILVANNAEQPASTSAVLPVSAPLTPDPETSQEPVDLVLDWSAPEAVLAPNWGGVVSDVYLKPGATIEHGTPLFALDGIDRLAWQLETSFYRNLTTKDAGPDVLELQRALNRQGLNVTETGTFDAQTLSAVREFAASINVPNSAKISTFESGWVVRIATEQLNVSSQALRVGQAAPAMGTEIIQPERALQSATAVISGSLTIDQLEIAAELGMITDLTSGVWFDNSASATIRTFAGTELELADDAPQITAGSLARLAEEVTPDQLLVIAQATQTSSEPRYTLPPSAIRTASSGATCILVGTAAVGEVAPEPVLVEVLGSLSGLTTITAASELPQSPVYYTPAGPGTCE